MRLLFFNQVMKSKLVFILAAILALVSCGVSSNVGSGESGSRDKTEKAKVKRVFSGERYVLTDYDRDMYSSLSEFIRLRCTLPARGVNSVNAGSSSAIFIVDGNQGSPSVPIQMVYSIKIVDPAFYGSYGFNAQGGVIEIETIPYHENMQKSGVGKK